MFHCYNNRFYSKGVSFRFPEGYALRTKTECIAEEYLFFIPPENTFVLELRIDHDCEPSNSELTDTLQNLGTDIVRQITPITLNGLHGHYAIYRGIRTQFYHARFDLPQNYALDFLISTPENILDVKIDKVFDVLDLKAI